jgi:acetamidase/formamidase
VPLAPFFGVMGTAPPPAWGALSTAPPRRNGGNLDNKELVAGTTLYLPIFVDGALFSCGDGHGVQGDGEVCITAVETGLTGTFRLTVRDDMKLTWPMAETPTHMITMAFDPDLDDCVVIALRQMLDLICERAGLDRYQAYSLASLTADLRVTQVVNGNKGIHVMLDKRYLTRAR